MRARLMVIVLGVVGLTGAFWWFSGRPSPDRAATSDGGAAGTSTATFVGREACAACHQAETSRWEGSYHDRAMQPADASTVRGDFGNASIRYAGVVSRFTTREGQYFVETDGPDGALQEYEVAYTFGDYPLQQYLVRFPGGRLQALSLAWDARPAAEGGERWFHLYPDEKVRAGDVLHWTGPAQNWNRQCAECHSTNLRKGYLTVERQYDTSWDELDVSCEACHGPGSGHIAWAEGREAGTQSAANKGFAFALARDERTWLMDPATGIARRDHPPSSRQEIETCARCHSRRSPIAVEYTYGHLLADTHRPALLEEGLYYADGQIQDEVYVYGSFLQSRMYAAGVTCSDCHDPHDLSVGASPDEVCARCHLPSTFATPGHHHHAEGSAGTSCVRCHMPARTYMVVDPRRDHSFRVPRPDLATQLEAPDACTSCHRDRTAGWAAARAAEWWPTLASRPQFGSAIAAGRRGAADAERRLRDLVLDQTVPAIARATALSLLGQMLSPVSIDAVAAGARDADPLVRAAAAEATGVADEMTRARVLAPLLSDPVRLVRISAGRAAASLPAALLTVGQRAARERALDEWIAAQHAQADTPGAHVNLGVLHAERGEAARAREGYEEALRLQPAFVPALVNLADLHRAAGEEEEAERVLRAGIDRIPDDPALHHALGLLLVRTGRRAEALPLFERARTLAPDDPGYAYVLGVAYWSAGRRDAALSLLARSHEAHPGDRETLAALVAYSRESGDRAATLRYARRLAELSPFDPGVRRLIDELQQSN